MTEIKDSKSINQISNSTKRINWGIVLSVLGISSMAIVKVLIGKDESLLSVAIVIISLIMLIDLNYLRYFKTPTRYVQLIFLYETITVVLSLINTFFYGKSIFEMPFGIIYQGCFFVQTLLLWNCRKIDTEHLMKLFFWYSGILAIIALILIFRDPVFADNNIFITGLYSLEGERIITRASTGVIGAYAFFASLAYSESKNKTARLVRYLFLSVGLVVSLLSNRRTVIGAELIVFIIWVIDGIRKRGLRWHIIFEAIGGLISLFVVAFLLSSLFGGEIPDFIGNSIESFSNALGSYFGIAEYYDTSANMRRVAWETAFSELRNSMSLFQFLFGHGYGSWWMDVPVLEAFWELGIVGGILFVIIQIVYPIIFILKKTDSAILTFVKFCLVLRIVDNFSSGTCYGIFFMLILYALLEYEKYTNDFVTDTHERSYKAGSR